MSKFKDDRDSMELFIIGIIVVLLMMFVAPVWPSDHDSDSDDDILMPVDIETTVGGDSTRLFSVGGSDMEISGCLATTSWLFGLRQSAKVNPDCEAVREAKRLDKEGQHEAAAKMRCGTKLYSKRFGKEQACVDAVQIGKQNTDDPLDVPPNLTGLYNQAAQYDERYEQQQELEQKVEKQSVNLAVFQERFDRIDAAAQKAATEKRKNYAYDQKLLKELKNAEPQND